MQAQHSVDLSIVLAFAPLGILWTFLPIHLHSLGATFSTISLVALVPALETILLSPLWGGLLDNTRKARNIVFMSSLAQALGFSLFPLLAVPEEFVLVVAVTGLFTSSLVPVYSTIATRGSAGHGRSVGGFWAAASLGFGSATLLGGILYDLYGATYLFVLGAVCGYAGCLAVVFGPKDSALIVRYPQRYGSYLGLLKQRKVAVLGFISVLTALGTSAFNIFFALYLVEFLGASNLLAGLAVATGALLEGLAFRFIGPLNDRIGRKPTLLLGTTGYGLYFLIIYFTTNPVLATMLWSIPVFPLIQSSLTTLMSDYTPITDRGKGLGLLESGISLGDGLGPFAGGLIADATGLRMVIIFCLAMALTSTLSSNLLLKEETIASPDTPQARIVMKQ